MKSTKLAALFLVSLLPLAACKSHEAENTADNAADTATSAQNAATAPADQTSQSSANAVTQTTEGEIKGTSNPNDLNPVKAQTMIDDVTIGHNVADGQIAKADQGDDFAPGQPIYLAMKVADTPASSKVKVAWYGPNDAKISDEEKAVPQGAKYMSFSQTKTASWAKGDYRAEVWIGDEKVNTQHFNITEKSKAGK
jgi:hypothetical protein